MAPPPTKEELGDTRGPLAQWLRPERVKPRSQAYDTPRIHEAPKTDPKVEADFQAALELFRQGKLDQAERAFARLERRKLSGGSFEDVALELPKNEAKQIETSGGRAVSSGPKRRWTPWGEKVLYYLAETRYQRGNYMGAVDTFDKLMTDYPGTQFLDRSVQRLYGIGEFWLALVDPVPPPQPRDSLSRPTREQPQKDAATQKAKHQPDAKLASRETDDAPRKKPEVSWQDHMKGKVPLIDVGGHAIRVFEHVRKHDPTGPLADDAAWKIAEYYAAVGDYETSADYYDQLIMIHPKSDLVHKARLAAIQAKIKSYLGPDYDASDLEQARDLIRQTLATYPERQVSTDDELYRSLALIDAEQAAITYRQGEFYKRTGKPAAAELYLGEVVARWPKSEWAEKSRIELAEIKKLPRERTLPSKILTPPGAPDPLRMGATPGQMSTSPGAFMPGGMGGVGGVGP